jgi:malate dehydrogenase (oxaloacetate-decarboxylating)(NADP+)
MTIVLTPYWDNGVQKLKLARQRKHIHLKRNFFFEVNPHPTEPAKPAHGLTPPTLDDSVHGIRCLAQLRSKDKDIEKYIYLSQLKDADPNMFYRLCLQYMPVRNGAASRGSSQLIAS